ncbi:Rieske (2Fe-2S) protein [Sinomonas humi]|uniref:Iron-sulfur protein n=1 Tax=Sinomonas humi TaxID=1338436 RepID=A0A0B2AQ12_9MICC|nr:Rieske (2Fe-2S) protein [Sinomonas humi]KHL04049.1 iron-sulfur protein [Sinomonas humi]
MNLLDDAVSRLERWQFLDAIAEPVRKATHAVVKPRLIRNLLSGIPTGHPLHPVLTDIPIGAWTMASLLDLRGGKASEPAADLLVAAGLLAAVPTAAAGLNDWSDTFGPTGRIGLVHAGLNSAALGLYTASLVARRTGRRGAGCGLALAGLGILTASGYLGGHLSYSKGVKVSHTAYHEGPTDWQDAIAESELDGGEPQLVNLDDIPLLVMRDGGQIVALDNVCTHAGGPLNEGTFEDGCVTCPWHGSKFRLTDGAPVYGPAAAPQPSYETRVQDGRVQVRARV